MGDHYRGFQCGRSLQDDLGTTGCDLLKSFPAFCLLVFVLTFFFFPPPRAYSIQHQQSEIEDSWNDLFLAVCFGWIFFRRPLPLCVPDLLLSSEMPPDPLVTPDLPPEY